MMQSIKVVSLFILTALTVYKTDSAIIGERQSVINSKLLVNDQNETQEIQLHLIGMGNCQPIFKVINSSMARELDVSQFITYRGKMFQVIVCDNVTAELSNEYNLYQFVNQMETYDSKSNEPETDDIE